MIHRVQAAGDPYVLGKPHTGPHRRTGAGPVVPAFWETLSIRWRLLLAVIILNLLAGAVAAAIIVYNAKRATEVEIAASMDMAEGFVRGVVQRHLAVGAETDGGAPGLDALPFQVDRQRHVRIQVFDAHGALVETGTAMPLPGNGADGAEHESFPDWFAALIGMDTESRSVPVNRDGRHLGAVRIDAEASDEIAEVWEDVSDLAMLALGANGTVILLLYVVLGRLLAPLSAVSRGLQEMERGQYQYRLCPPRIRELAAITGRFNALAESLQGAREENTRLTRRLVTAQDDERRQIAMELHDELGSYLFGLKANTQSLRQLTADFPEETGRPLWERADALIDITEEIQATNRRLLKRIRPMALGHVSLAGALADLVGDFERYAPDIRFTLEADGLAPGYGDCVDLTLYRCLQESLTNAVRHGAPSAVEIRVADGGGGAKGNEEESAGRVLTLSVHDDGRGLPGPFLPGLGLTGIQTRVHALGGRFEIRNGDGPDQGGPNGGVAKGADGGTTVDITIPLTMSLAGEQQEEISP